MSIGFDPSAFSAGQSAGGHIISGLLAAQNGGTGDNGSSPSIAQRLVAGLQGANQGYEAWQQKQAQITAAGKAADYMRKALGDDAEQITGIADEEWANFGPKEKAAAAQGLAQKQAQDQVKSEIARNQGTAAWMNQRGQDSTDPDAAAKARFAQMFLQRTQPQMQPGGAAGGPNLSASMLLGMRPPAQPNPQPLDIARMMMQSGMDPVQALTQAGRMPRNEDAGADAPASAPVFGKSPSGTGYAQLGKDFQWDPTDVQGLKTADQLKLQAGKTPEQMTDAQRENMIVQHGNARARLLQMLDKTDAKANPEAYQAITDELGAHNDAIAGLRGAKGKPAVAASAGAKPARADVSYLAAHPELTPLFEQRFGKGSAAQYLP